MIDTSLNGLDKILRFAKAAKEFIDSHAADPDITEEMCKKYSAYKKALSDLGFKDSDWDFNPRPEKIEIRYDEEYPNMGGYEASVLRRQKQVVESNNQETSV